MKEKPKKPLGKKAYGSIPHLPGSRLGPADHHCHDGQSRICQEAKRDRHDRVIVTEKLDGSCVSVANVDGEITALIRAGYRASNSTRPFLQAFDTWVGQNERKFAETLLPGERLCGEWLISTHGTLYAYTSPFVAFDLIDGDKRLPFDDLQDRCFDARIRTAMVLSDGPCCSIEQAMEALGSYGFHGALEKPEGAVWRVERRGVFDFIAKYVRHDKVDGKYWEGSEAA
jgi:hypothetical protein